MSSLKLSHACTIDKSGFALYNKYTKGIAACSGAAQSLMEQ